MVELEKYINKKNIRLLSLTTREEVITKLVDTLSEDLDIDRETLYNAVVNREKIVTTGIGMGVAIPHAKLSTFTDFHICIGILDQEIDWNSLDENPVRLVFLIGGPENKQTEYLQILSTITHAIKNDTLRKKLFLAKSSEEAYAEFTGK